MVDTKKVSPYVSHSFDIGEIVRVEELGFSEGAIKCRQIDGDDYDFFHPLNIAKATDEEVAEAKALAEQSAKDAVFTQAGRKPNEYRKGDIVRADKSWRSELNGHIGVVEDVDADTGSIGIRFYNGGSYAGVFFEDGGKATLIATVESRLDRK